jgi:hypothetical protein
VKSEPSRRAVSRSIVAGALALLARPRRSDATDYAGAEQVLDAVDRLEADVGARLRAIAGRLAAARRFVSSLLADHERHRAVRARLRRRLRLPASAPAREASGADAALDGLRVSQEALVYAHAEGLPALGDAFAVGAMARNMVDLSRHLTVIDLWIEGEASRG